MALQKPVSVDEYFQLIQSSSQLLFLEPQINFGSKNTKVTLQETSMSSNLNRKESHENWK